MQINRDYTHRTFGAIGSVTFETPEGKYVLNGTELPESSVAHLMTFALQTLQDAYAGDKSAEDAIASFETKQARLIEGTIGTRSSGGVDEQTRVARSVVRAAAKAKFGAKSEDWAKFEALTDDAQNEKLDAWFTANEAAFTPAVDEEMARRAAKRDAKAGLAKSVDISL